MKKIIFLIFSISLFISQAYSQNTTITTNPIISGDTLYTCGELQIDFIGSTTGGSAPYTYAWDFGDGTNSTGANITHTYNSYGLYQVSLLSTDNSSNTDSTKIWVKIYVKPQAYAGVNDTTCEDLYVFNATANYGIGRWLGLCGFQGCIYSSTGNGFSNVPNDTVTITGQLGVYNFIWYVENDSLQGCFASDTVQIIFAGRPLGIIDTVYSALCVGDTFGINAKANYAYANPSIFTWNTDTACIIDTTIHGVFYPVFSWPNSTDTVHTVELIAENIYGCKSPKNTITLHDPPKLNPLITIVQPSSGNSDGEIYLTKYLDFNNHNYYVFKWIDTLSNGDWLLPEIYMPSIPSSYTMQIGLISRDYHIQVRGEQRANLFLTYQHFCYDTITVNLFNVGIKNYINTNDIVIYPNPASTYLQVESKKFKVESFSIYDIAGRNLTTGTNPDRFSKPVRVDITNLQKGIYFIKLQTEKGVVVKKFVKD